MRRKVTLIHGIEKDVKRDFNASRRIHPTAAGLLAMITLSLIGTWLLDDAGRRDLAYPIMDSVLALVITVRVKWQLTQRVWFWITMSIFLTVHVAIISLVQWTTNWVPAPVNAGYACADFILMLVILDTIARLTKATRTRLGSDGTIV